MHKTKEGTRLLSQSANCSPTCALDISRNLTFQVSGCRPHSVFQTAA